MSAKFLIVVPHYGEDGQLVRLLESLGIKEMPDINGERISHIPSRFGEVYVVNNNIENCGFTKACNDGIRYAVKNNFDHIWLLNNDTEVENIDKAIGDFEKEFSDSPKTGIIGCRIVVMDDQDFIHHGGTLSVFPNGIHKTGRISHGDLDTRTVEKWVTGASMVISRDAVWEIGTLDEKFVNYASDSDYCYRARLAGFDVVYLPVTIRHKMGESAHPSPKQMEIMERDITHFSRKWIEGGVFRDLN